MNLWDRILTSFWLIEDRADGGPMRHAWLHFTSSWFYLVFAVVSLCILLLGLLSIGSIYTWLGLHAIAIVAIFRFQYDRNPKRREERRRARKARRR